MIVFKIENADDCLEMNWCDKGLYIQIESSGMQNIILTFDEAEELQEFLESYFKSE